MHTQDWVHDITIRSATVNGSSKVYMYCSIPYDGGFTTTVHDGFTAIYDISNLPTQPSSPIKLQRTGYKTHTTFPTEDGKYIFLTHENLPGERNDAPNAAAGRLEIWQTNLGTGLNSDMVRVGFVDPVDLGFERNHLVHDVWVMGNLLYVSWYKEGLQVFNIANPVKPFLVGSYRTSEDWAIEWCETGNWGIFPLLGQNMILASDIEFGLYRFTFTDKQSIAAGSNHTVAIRGDGNVYSWGKNDFGQMGNGTTGSVTLSPASSTANVAGSPSFTSVAAGQDFTIALRRDGLLYGWGANPTGNLGNGTTNNSPAPVQVSGSGYTAIVAGGLHCLALKKDGSLWTWGYNGEGELGNGSTGNLFVPTQITLTSPTSSNNDWVAIAAGSNHSLAIKVDGSLWAWGWNAYGQVGNGGIANVLRPVRIGSATDWVSIKAGQRHTLGLKKNGTMAVWGDNSWGQLGLGNNTSSLVPVSGPSGSNWASIGAGMGHSFASQKDGSLYIWGLNQYGQIGNNSTTNVLSPFKAGSASPGWYQVSSREQNTLGLRLDGTLWACGNNATGTLGLGNTTTPYKTMTLSSKWSSDYLAFGAVTTIPDNSVVDLTTEGLQDWGKWGDRGVYTYEHKNLTTSEISSTAYGTAQIWNQNEIGFSWTDGFPDPILNSRTVQYSVGLNTGMDITLPASTTPRTLFLYLGLGQCQAQVTATLAAQAGGQSISTSFTQNNGLSGHIRLPVYVTASTSQQTLRISYRVTQDFGGGNVALEAVSLQAGP